MLKCVYKADMTEQKINMQKKARPDGLDRWISFLVLLSSIPPLDNSARKLDSSARNWTVAQGNWTVARGNWTVARGTGQYREETGQ